MKKYKKIYFDFHDFGEQDIILCENCEKLAVDIHHIIFKSQCGTDKIENLIALCRECHNKAHSDKDFNAELKLIKDIEFLI